MPESISNNHLQRFAKTKKIIEEMISVQLSLVSLLFLFLLSNLDSRSGMARELSLIISHSNCSTSISCFLGLLWGWELLGCSLQACKPCTCPAPRIKKEPWVSHRDIDGLIDGGILHIWSSKFPERHPNVAADSRRNRAASSLPREEGGYQL